MPHAPGNPPPDVASARNKQPRRQVGDNINAYNNYERTFYCVVEVLGVFFYSAVVGQMATLVATLNVTINRHG